MEQKENIKKSSTKEFPLLDNITAVFSVRDQERKKRLEVAKVKNEVNKVHVQFIKNNLLSKDEYSRAAPAVSEWAKKNGVNRNKTKMTKRKSNFDKIAFSDATLKRQRIVDSVTSSPLQSNQKNSTARFRPELASSTQSFINDSQMSKSGSASIRNHRTDSINNIIQSEVFDQYSSDVLTYTSKNVEPMIDLTKDSDVEGHRKEPILNSVLNAEPSVQSLQCKVLNCEVTCDSITAYEYHYQHFVHSSCNPFVNMQNSALDDIPLLYNCPRCEETFHRKLDCQEHMIFEDHLPTLLPIPICGYMCPQCCLIFRNIIQCHTHMSNSNHCNVTYAFAGDGEQVLSGNVKSIPISYYLANQFYLKCQAKLFKVSCVVCDIEVKTSDELDEHISYTRHQHFQSSSSSTPEEVFAEFLTDKTCSMCAKIIWEGDTEKGFHACDRTQIGWLVDNDNCKTFKEFVRRCSITQENETQQDSDVTFINSDSEIVPMGKSALI